MWSYSLTIAFRFGKVLKALRSNRVQKQGSAHFSTVSKYVITIIEHNQGLTETKQNKQK